MAVDYAYVCPLVSREEHSTVLAVIKNPVPVYRRLGLSEIAQQCRLTCGWMFYMLDWHRRIKQQGYPGR
jgi:hypothetical protein